MEQRKLLELLGRAFANGEMDALESVLYKDCKYNSDYAHRRLTSADQILDNMRSVYDAVLKNEKDCSYTYEIIRLESILKTGITLDDLHEQSFFDVCDEGLLLHQFGAKEPVAVVYIKVNPGGTITEINLSRNTSWFDMRFYGETDLQDSEKDIPYTVKPVTPHDRQVKEMQEAWTYQKKRYEELDDSEVYIWRKADQFFKQWLKDAGYYLLETQIFDDCIGYKCNRNNYSYTIYMYAYGQYRTVKLDGDYCRKLIDHKLSENSIVLVVYLNVKRQKDNEKFTYKVCNYAGNEDRSLELWKVSEVSGKMILEFYPRKEMMDLTFRLMYAFNRDNRDVYDCIICKDNPSFYGVSDPGRFMNAAFFTRMFNLHKEYGDMKVGYVRLNDVIYSQIPYIDDYGYFGFSVDNHNRIQEITAYPFEGGERKVIEFIKTDEKESDEWYSHIPNAVAVCALDPVYTERFAIKVLFDNGECKKYILPIQEEEEKDETVSYEQHVFTDKIWKTAKIIESDLPHRGTVIQFINEFFISVLKCYEEGEPYSEPELCTDIVFDNNEYRIERKWKWNVEGIYEDEDTGLLKTLLSGNAFNYYGVSTYASCDGKRLCSINFDYIDNFQEGLAKVAKSGYGYGFIDKDMNFAVPMIYDYVDEFNDGKAKARRGDQWFHIDRTGKDTKLVSSISDSKYQDIGEYSEGMCKVSTLKLGFMDLAYHSDYSEIAGKWGYINEAGEEIIAPQYIYAADFNGGIALVCKGEWTIDKKWDNKYNTGRYWTDEELWGAIDKEGNEVIPFIFDEIKTFWDVDDVFMAHFGGWENGHWGVIDNRGNWLAQPIFEDIDYEYQDGLFAFYKEDKWGDDVPLGIYDIKQQKVIFEPQFFDVSFCEDGWIEVEVFNESLGRKIEKLIDRNGNEKFHSEYSRISAWKHPYEVTIRDETGDCHGLIDENGNVLLPCGYDVYWNGIYYDQRKYIYIENEKQGIKDFDGNIIIPAVYHNIGILTRPLLTVSIGDKEDHKDGLITMEGTEVLPAEYESISWCRDDHHIICRKDGSCEMLLFTEKKK